MSEDQEEFSAPASRRAARAAGMRDAGVRSLIAALPPMEYARNLSVAALEESSTELHGPVECRSVHHG
jgi:hypothetical protein